MEKEQAARGGPSVGRRTRGSAPLLGLRWMLEGGEAEHGERIADPNSQTESGKGEGRRRIGGSGESGLAQATVATSIVVAVAGVSVALPPTVMELGLPVAQRGSSTLRGLEIGGERGKLVGEGGAEEEKKGEDLGLGWCFGRADDQGIGEIGRVVEVGGDCSWDLVVVDLQEAGNGGGWWLRSGDSSRDGDSGDGGGLRARKRHLGRGVGDARGQRNRWRHLRLWWW